MGGGPFTAGMSSNEHKMSKIAFLDLPDRKGGEFPRKSKGGRGRPDPGRSSGAVFRCVGGVEARGEGGVR